MSIQSKLEKAGRKGRWKFHDNTIRTLAKPTKSLHVKILEDKYGDDEELEFFYKGEIENIIKYPGEIPINRFRNTGVDSQVGQTNVFLFDILPIEVYTKWQDNLEVGDFIIDHLIDERENLIKILLKVTEDLGLFGTNYLFGRKCYAAPYSGELYNDIMDVISDTNFHNLK